MADTQSEVLTDVETALSVDTYTPLEDGKVKVIQLYIKLASKSVALYTGEPYDSLPDELTGIVTEMALAKFGKRGNEGKTSAAEEGLTDAWNVDDMAPYITQLNKYNDRQSGDGLVTNQGEAISFD